MSVLQDCRTAGILDTTWGLPLGKDGGRDNFMKDTAVLLALASPQERIEFEPKVYSFIAMTRVASGLYEREPGSTSRNSVDNLIGTMVSAKITNDWTTSKAILTRGLHYNWTYSLAYPETKFSLIRPCTWKAIADWYGKFVGFPPFVSLTLGALVGFVDLWFLYFSVWDTVRTPVNNTSDKILMWLMWQVMPQDHWLVKRAYAHWRLIMTAMYGDLAGLFSIYYGAAHPFTLAAKGRSF